MAGLEARGRNAGMGEARGRPTRVRVWRWPLLLALLTLFGLLSALLGQGGLWWYLSWIALAIPLLVIVVCLRRRSNRAANGLRSRAST